MFLLLGMLVLFFYEKHGNWIFIMLNVYIYIYIVYVHIYAEIRTSRSYCKIFFTFTTVKINKQAKVFVKFSFNKYLLLCETVNKLTSL